MNERMPQLFDIRKPIIRDSDYIANENDVMLLGLEYQYDTFGKEVVCEDGKITRVITRYKEVVG